MGWSYRVAAMKRRVIGAAACGFLAAMASLNVALLLARVALEWLESMPYQGAVNDALKIAIVVFALAIAAGGLVGSVDIYRRVRNGPQT